MALIDPKTPLRSDLERMCGGNQRLVKAFEKLFRILPSIVDGDAEAIQGAQMTADTALSNAFLAISLLEAIADLAEMVATEPKHECMASLNNNEYLPRQEFIEQDVLNPVCQSLEYVNFNLEVT
ncbi:hypothetical protein [Acinetobacter calcoaceticus]